MMQKSMLAAVLAGTAMLGACASNPTRVAEGAGVGALGGAAVGAIVPGVSVAEGAIAGAAIGGLAGALWSDQNNDGYVDGYMYNGQYYAGTPAGYDPTLGRVATGAAIGGVVGAGVGAVTGLGVIPGVIIGAAVGGLAGAVWADKNNDGQVDGYIYNGQYYQGQPPAAAAPAYSTPVRCVVRVYVVDFLCTRNGRTGPRPVRRLSIILGAVAALAAAPISSAAQAEAAAIAVPHGQTVRDFYKIRQSSPLWFKGGYPTAAAQALVSLLSTAQADGLDPERYGIDGIRDAIKRASGGDTDGVRKADKLLSEAFANYARDLKNPPVTGLQYLDPALRAGPPSPLRILQDAARAGSLTRFIGDMEWMNPSYAPLRRALVNGRYSGDRERELLQINLQRLRILPAESRYIVVNAPSQRLYMYDDGKLVDSMKVVVGQQKPDRKTPTIAGLLHYAALNPYWNVPPDLVWDDVGIYVEKYGLGYLKSRGYEILSDWSDNAVPIDPATVDWDAVKAGTAEIRVRQLPGPENFLGKVKYTFTNPYGIYLHDTPRKELLDKDIRLFSGGCIRLEDADRLGRWLFGHQLTPSSDDPEIKVPLSKPIPVYVTYLTAIPSGQSITYLDDVYGWDTQRLAQAGIADGEVAAR